MTRDAWVHFEGPEQDLGLLHASLVNPQGPRAAARYLGHRQMIRGTGPFRSEEDALPSHGVAERDLGNDSGNTGVALFFES
jgi:hypothetical protein